MCRTAFPGSGRVVPQHTVTYDKQPVRHWYEHYVLPVPGTSYTIDTWECKTTTTQYGNTDDTSVPCPPGVLHGNASSQLRSWASEGAAPSERARPSSSAVSSTASGEVSTGSNAARSIETTPAASSSVRASPPSADSMRSDGSPGIIFRPPSLTRHVRLPSGCPSPTRITTTSPPGTYSPPRSACGARPPWNRRNSTSARRVSECSRLGINSTVLIAVAWKTAVGSSLVTETARAPRSTIIRCPKIASSHR